MRLIKQGAVKIDEQKIEDPKFKLKKVPIKPTRLAKEILRKLRSVDKLPTDLNKSY